MRIALPFVAIAFAVALTFPAEATSHLCKPTTSPANHTLKVNGRTFYVVMEQRQCPDCVAGNWWIVYEETNGLAGLQRRDTYKDDTCKGVIRSDTIVDPI